MGLDEQPSSPMRLPLIIASLSNNNQNISPPLSSQPKTFANVFISIVGAGVLGLPYAFKRTGWLTSLLILVPIAALTYHCMMLLVRTRRRLEAEEGAKIVSFGDLGLAVCGPFGRAAVDFMIVFSQAGFCAGYLIFIANTLAHLYPNPQLPNPKAAYILACFPFQLALNSIPTLTHLAPLSIFADVIDLGAMGMVMIDDVAAFQRSHPPVNPFGSVSTLFYGIGVAVYAFEGIGMVLPLESEMEKKDRFGKILALSMSFITLMYASFGLLGYIAFGDATRDIITANLQRGSTATLVQLALCINLFLTFPLMMNPVYEVVERMFSKGRYSLPMRFALVVGVSLVALLVPNFADFLSLVGSSFGCALAFVLPALFHLVVFWEESGVMEFVADGCILLFGVFFGVCGTWYALLEILSAKV
uniref:Amino acid transporter transmembrane domain-containing protein n=1 Tax=Kalanchoe fedtschenkoi TaxID=63787 RepID=A0A7N0UXW6_KALFE